MSVSHLFLSADLRWLCFFAFDVAGPKRLPFWAGVELNPLFLPPRLLFPFQQILRYPVIGPLSFRPFSRQRDPPFLSFDREPKFFAT